MPVIRFHSSSEYSQQQNNISNILFISDELTQFSNLHKDGVISSLLHLSDSEIELLKSASITQLSPTLENPSSFETMLMKENGIVRVSFGVLPSAFSRHNTPSRSHAVTQIVKERKGSNDLTIVLLPSTLDYFFAQACAAVRPFFEYSGKQKQLKHVTIDIVSGIDNAGSDLKNISHVAEGIKLCQRLVDAPPNVLHTDAYVAGKCS